MKKTLLFAFVSMFAMQANAATQDLINSVKAGNTKEVIDLLNNGENVNGTNGIGTTALHYAVASDNAEITQILLSYGADLNATNSKGWTPLKIAEKKDLKNVTPVLVQYLQLQKDTSADSVKETAQKATDAINDVPVKAEEVVVKAVEVVKEAPVKAEEAVVKAVEVIKEVPVKEDTAEVVEAVEVIKEVPVKEDAAEVVEAVEVVKEAPAQAEEAVNTDTEVKTDYQDVVALATQAVIEARSEKNKAETEAKILADELKQVKAEKAELEAKLSEKEKAEKEVKKEAKPEVKAEVKETPKEEAKKEVKTPVAAKPAPKPVKPVLQKKPVYKAPQPIVKKAVVKPSTMVEGIYAGDEEIVYCLDYLGNGEDDNFKRAAGHFAASASISEARYKQIVDKANTYFMNADDRNMTLRNNECSEVVFSNEHDKQNQIIRSINKSVGY